ncbi:hypothetical protein CPT76_35555 [Paenibacillus sp. AR247]|nr:hypothetical protein CPT76_35555 [Paenibacillus sp. AR247]
MDILPPPPAPHKLMMIKAGLTIVSLAIQSDTGNPSNRVRKTRIFTGYTFELVYNGRNCKIHI